MSTAVSSAPAPAAHEVREQLRKMCRHRALSRSKRLCRFLEFVVEMALERRADELKEFTVAVHAFDKDESFDPRIDPIVRVEAGRLRQRIDDYYRDNPNDLILIRLRSRGYRPVVRWMKASDRIQLGMKRGRSGRDAARKPTIAVRAFESLTPERDGTRLSRIIAERIADLLPELTNLQPIGGIESSQPYRRVAADFVLQGTVQQNRRRIRVIASVFRQRDGIQVWSDTVDRRVQEDLFDLQDDIAFAIASRLRTE